MAHGPEFDAFSLVNISVAVAKSKRIWFFFPPYFFFFKTCTDKCFSSSSQTRIGWTLSEGEGGGGGRGGGRGGRGNFLPKRRGKTLVSLCRLRTRRKETLLSRKNKTQRERLGKDVHYFSVSVLNTKAGIFMSSRRENLVWGEGVKEGREGGEGGQGCKSTKTI